MFSSTVEPNRAIRFFSGWTLHVVRQTLGLPSFLRIADDGKGNTVAASSAPIEGAQADILLSPALDAGGAGALDEKQPEETITMRPERPGEIEARDMGQPKGVGVWNVPSQAASAAL